MELKSKTVLITGGSSGIGQACARRMASQGARLVLTGRSRDALENVARTLTSTEIITIPADLRDPVQIDMLCETALGRFPTIDILVNSAGVGLIGPAYEVSPENVRHLFEVNVLAPIELVRRLVPAMPRGGVIVNISSLSAKIVFPGYSVYTASKLALSGFSAGLRMELRRKGIHVLDVCPGVVDTPFLSRLLQGHGPKNVKGQRFFRVTADRCAAAILDGLRRNRRTLVIPWTGWILVGLVRVCPRLTYGWIKKMAQTTARSRKLPDNSGTS